MPRLIAIATRTLPLITCAILGGCSVTDRQLADFAASTTIRVVTTAAASVFEAAVVAAFGSA